MKSTKYEMYEVRNMNSTKYENEITICLLLLFSHLSAEAPMAIGT